MLWRVSWACFQGVWTDRAQGRACRTVRPDFALPREQFQEKCETVFRLELRNFKDLDHFSVSMKQ